MGRPLAQRLLAQGEAVVDVPAKLAAGVRVFDTGNAGKTDATDAHAVAMVALRTPRLSELAYDEELIALRLLADRRDELSRRRVRTVNRLHRLVTELIPGGAKRDLSAQQAKRLLATVKPRSLVGKTIRRMAAEEIADLVAVVAYPVVSGVRGAGLVSSNTLIRRLPPVETAGSSRVGLDPGCAVAWTRRRRCRSDVRTVPGVSRRPSW